MVWREGEVAVKILLADDHEVLREGLISLLSDYPEFVVVAEAKDGRQALELARRVQPDVVILDLMLPVMDGIQVARKLRQNQQGVRIIILSALTGRKIVDQAMAAGADGYVSKTRCIDDLVNALRLVMEGKSFISSGMGRSMSHTEQRWTEQGQRIALLTSRERQVMGLIAAGLGNKQIAYRLGISIHTVRNHRQRLMAKLDVHDTATLTRFAIAWGILDQAENWSTA